MKKIKISLSRLDSVKKVDLPVYRTRLSVLDFLEWGADGEDIFLTGGGLYPGGLYLADLTEGPPAILVTMLLGPLRPS